MILVFLGRRSVTGIRTGTLMSATGVAGVHQGALAILNPVFEIISIQPMPEQPSEHH